MSHYFTDNRNLEQNRREKPFRFLGVYYTFITDNGVFSKSEVDFGTWVLLKTICEQDLGERVLDLGCGYGVVGVVCKKMFPAIKVTCVDVNPRAVELTALNASKNEVELEVMESNIYSNVKGEFSSIVTNPPIRAGKSIIYAMFEEGKKHLMPGGCLWVVIRKQQGALSAKKKIEEVFGNCEIVDREKGYFILKAINRA